MCDQLTIKGSWNPNLITFNLPKSVGETSEENVKHDLNHDSCSEEDIVDLNMESDVPLWIPASALASSATAPALLYLVLPCTRASLSALVPDSTLPRTSMCSYRFTSMYAFAGMTR